VPNNLLIIGMTKIKERRARKGRGITESLTFLQIPWTRGYAATVLASYSAGVIAAGRVTARPVIEHLGVLEDILPCRVTSRVVPMTGSMILEVLMTCQ
jgi:hypothetical protein